MSYQTATSIQDSSERRRETSFYSSLKLFSRVKSMFSKGLSGFESGSISAATFKQEQLSYACFVRDASIRPRRRES